jgi:hypothetical protein
MKRLKMKRLKMKRASRAAREAGEMSTALL